MIRKIALAAIAGTLALSGPVAIADAKPKKTKKCSAAAKEFFPWECR